MWSSCHAGPSQHRSAGLLVSSCTGAIPRVLCSTTPFLSSAKPQRRRASGFLSKWLPTRSLGTMSVEHISAVFLRRGLIVPIPAGVDHGLAASPSPSVCTVIARFLVRLPCGVMRLMLTLGMGTPMTVLLSQRLALQPPKFYPRARRAQAVVQVISIHEATGPCFCSKTETSNALGQRAFADVAHFQCVCHGPSSLPSARWSSLLVPLSRPTPSAVAVDVFLGRGPIRLQSRWPPARQSWM